MSAEGEGEALERSSLRRKERGIYCLYGDVCLSAAWSCLGVYSCVLSVSCDVCVIS